MRTGCGLALLIGETVALMEAEHNNALQRTRAMGRFRIRIVSLARAAERERWAVETDE